MARSLLKFLALSAPTALLFACSSSSGGTGGVTTTTTTTTTKSTTTTTSSTTTSMGTGGAASGACTDPADQAALAMHQSSISSDVQACTVPNIGNEMATSTCIQGKDGLSKACADCFAADGQCGATNCLSQCIGGVSAACSMCLDTNCTPAFNTCSGINGSPPTDAGTG